MSSFVEGRNAVTEALRGEVPVSAVLIAKGLEGEPISRIRALAAERGVPVRPVARRTLDERSVRGAHQGVMAEVSTFEYTPLAEVLRATEGRERSLLIALDHITDEGNLGAVVRSAEVAGADGVIIPKARSAAVGAVAHKTSAGAVSYLPVIREPNLVRALERCKEEGYWIAGASGAASQSVWDAPLDGRIVLVLGSEGAGLSRLAERACDFLVGLPVAGRVDSLNVAQAATVLAFEWVRRGADRR